MNLTLSQYSDLMKEKICFYCDGDISKESGSGLNRINNTKGYEVENVKPCCWVCNRIMNNFTVEVLQSKVFKIIKRMNQLKGKYDE